MRIYHEQTSEVPLTEETYEKFLELIKSDFPQLLEVINPMLSAWNITNLHSSLTRNELKKYKTMWALRKLEAEMENEGGVIVIDSNSEFHLRGFSDDLADKISKCIEEFFNK